MNTISRYIKHTCIGFGLALLSVSSAFANDYTVLSPDKHIELKVNTDNGILYSVSFDKEQILADSKIDLQIENEISNGFAEESLAEQATYNQAFDLQWGTNASISTSYDQLVLHYDNNYTVEFRVYNEGVAYRFASTSGQNTTIINECAEFNFGTNNTIYFPATKGFSTPFEPQYLPQDATSVKDGSLALSPMLIQTSGKKVALITETNLFSYPGMFLEKTTEGVKGVFPAYPKRENEQILGRLRFTNIPQLSKQLVRSTQPYIAQRTASETLPWRTILVANEASGLLNNQLVTMLAEQPTTSFNWVKPGKVAWDWYHKWNFEGVDFTAGINTDTYLYMIDFAAENNLQYVNIDDGWCKLHDLKNVNSNLDLTRVIAYAKKKDVGIFLWCTWQTLAEDVDNNLAYFADLEIDGLKVDFFDRCDQVVVDFINELAEKSAQHKLLLNLHGMYKPTGIQVTYPNVVNLEGVMGLEYNKFSSTCTPQHNLTIPFIRNVVGPMDYTPGGMLYQDQASFKKSWSNPHVMTDRAQQMAMYVVYHGGVQMLADSPTLYENDKNALNFLKDVPVSWDETQVIQGEIGESIAIARRKGNTWYVAAMTADTEYLFESQLPFLKENKTYTLECWQAGDTMSDLEYSSSVLSINRSITHKVKKASGIVLRLTEK